MIFKISISPPRDFPGREILTSKTNYEKTIFYFVKNQLREQV